MVHKCFGEIELVSKCNKKWLQREYSQLTMPVRIMHVLIYYSPHSIPQIAGWVLNASYNIMRANQTTNSTRHFAHASSINVAWKWQKRSFVKKQEKRSTFEAFFKLFCVFLPILKHSWCVFRPFKMKVPYIIAFVLVSVRQSVCVHDNFRMRS